MSYDKSLEGARAPVVTSEPVCQWFDAVSLGIEGRGWPVSRLESPYDRLPASARGVVRPDVWGLSHCSTGMRVRFVSDAQQIHARWSLRDEALSLGRMPATSKSGLDLYAKLDGRWVFAGSLAATSYPESQGIVAKGLMAGPREFMLYLPLFNGVDSLHIGVPEGSSVTPAPALPAQEKPIVVYGSSVVQGGCASRSGMGYVELLSRSLSLPTVNLGFSGNGMMEIEVAQLLAELDPALFVIDSLPNLQPGQASERLEPLLRTIRTARPTTPILLIACIQYTRSWVQSHESHTHVEKNREQLAIYHKLIHEGWTRLHHLSNEGLLGDDNLASVDGSHPSDLGFMRMATAIEPAVRKALSS